MLVLSTSGEEFATLNGCRSRYIASALQLVVAGIAAVPGTHRNCSMFRLHISSLPSSLTPQPPYRAILRSTISETSPSASQRAGCRQSAPDVHSEKSLAVDCASPHGLASMATPPI